MKESSKWNLLCKCGHDPFYRFGFDPLYPADHCFFYGQPVGNG